MKNKKESLASSFRGSLFFLILYLNLENHLLWRWSETIGFAVDLLKG